jgi:hypothetical protein
MTNNAKKYNSYKSVNVDGEDTTDYPQDSYVKPGTEQKVGKLDEYNKDKVNYNKQKSKVILNQSKIAASANQDKKLDDLIPSDIGDAIDNVFSTVDNLLSATGKLFFGGKKAKPAPKPKPQPKQPPPVQQVKAPPPVQAPAPVRQQPPPKQQYIPPPAAKQPVPPPAQQPAAAKKAAAPAPDNEVDNSPLISRTTTISDLDLPLELLSDPDIVRYFDQMKLYDKKVDGGLLNLSFRKASARLKKGRWGKLFMITYDRLKINNTMMSSVDGGLQRFTGMQPVYKALGRNFNNTEELKKAIEEDINSYLKTGEGSGYFHKFTYKVNKK